MGQIYFEFDSFPFASIFAIYLDFFFSAVETQANMYENAIEKVVHVPREQRKQKFMSSQFGA